MDYYQILRRSFEIVKREKALWIFGMVLAAFSGGGVSLNGNYSGISEIFKNKEKIPPETSEKFVQVLGAATSNPLSFFTSILTSIPLSFWIALVSGIIGIIAFYIILGIFMRNWATGAIFSSIAETEKKHDISLKKGSDAGRKSWKRLFLASLILWGGYFICTVISILLTIILLFIFSSFVFLKIILGIFLALVIITSIIFFVIISLWKIFAEIVISIENYSLVQALSFSWKITKKFFLEGMLMGLTNMGVGCLTGCLTMSLLLILAVLIFVGFLISKYLGIVLLIIIGIPLIIFVLGGILIQGIIKAVTSCNWILLFNELKKKDDFPV